MTASGSRSRHTGGGAGETYSEVVLLIELDYGTSKAFEESAFWSGSWLWEELREGLGGEYGQN